MRRSIILHHQAPGISHVRLTKLTQGLRIEFGCTDTPSREEVTDSQFLTLHSEFIDCRRNPEMNALYQHGWQMDEVRTLLDGLAPTRK